jgi:hypothetical protein
MVQGVLMMKSCLLHSYSIADYSHISSILEGTHFLVYADDVTILGGSLHTIKKGTEALVVASKEVCIEVNDEKLKYILIFRDQHAGQNHNLKVGNKSFERVKHFRYLGQLLTIQNSIHEEIKRRLKSGNACCHLV